MEAEGYKWPYHDSYAPDLSMNRKDVRVVRKAIQRQYYPKNEGSSCFNLKDLKLRKKGIKSIERQYVDKMNMIMPKTATAAVTSKTGLKMI